MVFILFWFIASAIISSLEHSEENMELTEEQISKEAVNALTTFLKLKKEHFENNTVLANQLEKIIDIMETNPDMPRLWAAMDLEMALVQHDMVKTIVDVVKDEFARVELNLNEDDKSGLSLANKMIKLLSEENTVTVFRESGEQHVQKLNAEEKEKEKKCLERKAEGRSCGEARMSFGNALHFTSTVFTTTGYGAHSPITTEGKFLTIFLIIFQIPFFLHCLAITASHINTLLDAILGLSSKHEDLESLTTGTANSRHRRLVLLKGLLILASVLLVHMAVAAVYHYCTTGWSFSDVLYFEFVRSASVGFGDIIPEDEYTLAGAIFKNLLVNIPGQIVTFAIFVRALPLIS